jgi:hypothetical protein
VLLQLNSLPVCVVAMKLLIKMNYPSPLAWISGESLQWLEQQTMGESKVQSSPNVCTEVCPNRPCPNLSGNANVIHRASNRGSPVHFGVPCLYSNGERKASPVKDLQRGDTTCKQRAIEHSTIT